MDVSSGRITRTYVYPSYYYKLTIEQYDVMMWQQLTPAPTAKSHNPSDDEYSNQQDHGTNWNQNYDPQRQNCLDGVKRIQKK